MGGTHESMPCEVPTQTMVDLWCEMQVWLAAIIRKTIHTMFKALPPMGNWYNENAIAMTSHLPGLAGELLGVAMDVPWLRGPAE